MKNFYSAAIAAISTIAGSVIVIAVLASGIYIAYFLVFIIIALMIMALVGSIVYYFVFGDTPENREDTDFGNDIR